MAFLKLGDLIDGGHPVTVGDDGTVFTRLNMGQLVDADGEATGSQQEMCVEDLPGDFLSDPSFAINDLANEAKLTVIDFDGYQNNGFQQNVSSSQNTIFDLKDSSLLNDLNDEEIACTSRELLESCLQYAATERESEFREEYLNGDVLVTNLQDSFDDSAIAAEHFLQSKYNKLDTGDETGDEVISVKCSDPADGSYPEDLRVLFDIGNLSIGQVPQHHGFIKLTSNDCISAVQDNLEEETIRETTNVQQATIDSPKFIDSDDEKSETQIISETIITIEPIEEELKDSATEIDVTDETGLIVEIDWISEPISFEPTLKPCLTEHNSPDSDCSETFRLQPYARRQPETWLNPESLTVGETEEEESNVSESEFEVTVKVAVASESIASEIKLGHAKLKRPDSDCDATLPPRPDAKRLRPHVVGSTEPFPCTAPGCGLAFRFASYLARHVNAKHRGVRDYECLECGGRFSTGRDLAVHERKHTGERPEPCAHPECGLSFSTRAIANAHYLAKHCAVKRFKCDTCGKSFGSLSNLGDHRAIHLGVKDFVCPLVDCGKAFQTKGKLKRHDLSHTKLKPFECKQCSRTFQLNSVLKKHVKTKHTSNGND